MICRECQFWNMKERGWGKCNNPELLKMYPNFTSNENSRCGHLSDRNNSGDREETDCDKQTDPEDSETGKGTANIKRIPVQGSLFE